MHPLAIIIVPSQHLVEIAPDSSSHDYNNTIPIHQCIGSPSY